MTIKYYVTVNKVEKEKSSEEYDLVTTRKAEYTKFAKDELKKGAESVDIHAVVKDQFTGEGLWTYINTIYPEDFKINK